jgi:hypothetical protein
VAFRGPSNVRDACSERICQWSWRRGNQTVESVKWPVMRKKNKKKGPHLAARPLSRREREAQRTLPSFQAVSSLL